jgi:hypothetical protein
VLGRVFAREAAMKVASDGLRWVLGAEDGGMPATGAATLEAALGLPAIHAAQAGLLNDMERCADMLYGRAG